LLIVAISATIDFKISAFDTSAELGATLYETTLAESVATYAGRSTTALYAPVLLPTVN
jgi:hypothetical protein